MRGKRDLIIALVLMALCVSNGLRNQGTAAEGKRIQVRVLYVGHLGTPRGRDRERDFVGFLEKHFTKVGKGDLDKFEAKDANDFDVVILDYDGLRVEDNAIRLPRVPFDRSYTRPTVTLSSLGGIACDLLGLKMGYY